MSETLSAVILGGGHVAMTLYADLVLKRQAEVTVVSTGSVEVDESFVFEDIVSHDITQVTVDRTDFITWDQTAAARRALIEAAIVFVTIPDSPAMRVPILQRLIHAIGGLKKIVVLIRGGQGGALTLSEVVHGTSAQSWEVLLVEDSFYGTRRVGQRLEYKRKNSLNVAHYGSNLRSTVETLRSALPDAVVDAFNVKTPLQLLFDPLGYYIHAAVALDDENIELTRRGETYLHFSEGVNRTLAPKLDDMDSERVLLAASYGVEAEAFPQILKRQYAHEPRATFFETLRATSTIYRSRSPKSLRELRASRSLREDIPALLTILTLADVAGIKLTATASFAARLPAQLEKIGANVGAYPGYGESRDDASSIVQRINEKATIPSA